jgi:AAA ATPase domain
MAERAYPAAAHVVAAGFRGRLAGPVDTPERRSAPPVSAVGLQRSMSARRPPVLLGRGSERRLLGRLIENVRAGQSAVLVMRGEAGVGKTALLHECARQAAGCRVARVAGVQSEMELRFAGLLQLCGRCSTGSARSRRRSGRLSGWRSASRRDRAR